MKRKESNKKLSISKRTIANLNNPGMGRILGGKLWETETEPSIDPDHCAGGEPGTDECPSFTCATHCTCPTCTPC
jgi:hypothetical protein